VLVSVRDVSARRAAERSLEHALVDMRAALDEREVLLKEIHHRVKNNLQIVSSLLAMQSDRSASEEARSALEQSVHRVRSMALIHQQLYGGDDLARVELSDYVPTLVTELRSALAPTAEVVFDVTPTEVEVETAIPCGLILNELVVNAFKHGCDAGGRCRLHITLDREEGRIRLGVADAGPGVPPGFDVAKLRRATSLGMRLIAALTQQINATLRLDAGPGARFSLVLSAEPVQRTAHPSLRAPSQRP
jgi:two-component sensor histidine kinase